MTTTPAEPIDRETAEKLGNMCRAHLDGVYVFSARENCDELVTQLNNLYLNADKTIRFYESDPRTESGVVGDSIELADGRITPFNELNAAANMRDKERGYTDEELDRAVRYLAALQPAKESGVKELVEALDGALDSLKYVQTAHPEATGRGVRAARIL
jgi:hypothetical protein